MKSNSEARPLSQSAFGNADVEAIRQVHEAWIAAELGGDHETLLALCADDVRWLLPDAVIVEGKEAGRRFLEDASVLLESIHTADLRAEGSGTLAYKTCRYETRCRVPGSPRPRLVRGTHLWILRSVAGHWKVAFVTWQPEGNAP
jgi:ketosteroid isomerase-like protein